MPICAIVSKYPGNVLQFFLLTVEFNLDTEVLEEAFEAFEKSLPWLPLTAKSEQKRQTESIMSCIQTVLRKTRIVCSNKGADGLYFHIRGLLRRNDDLMEDLDI